jgi:hypothetical protein
MAMQQRLTLTRRGLIAGAAASGALLGRGAWTPGYAAAGVNAGIGDPWRMAELIIERLGELPVRC